mmetsp:Transcript_27993/g.89208  ORF Transcript_27993/g.89208 Transcript_27993/m.89208 type:complete len:262 (+) Transcript_27993:2709-3494(+)
MILSFRMALSSSSPAPVPRNSSPFTVPRIRARVEGEVRVRLRKGLSLPWNTSMRSRLRCAPSCWATFGTCTSWKRPRASVTSLTLASGSTMNASQSFASGPAARLVSRAQRSMSPKRESSPVPPRQIMLRRPCFAMRRWIQRSGARVVSSNRSCFCSPSGSAAVTVGSTAGYGTSLTPCKPEPATRRMAARIASAHRPALHPTSMSTSSVAACRGQQRCFCQHWLPAHTPRRSFSPPAMPSRHLGWMPLETPEAAHMTAAM